MTSRIIVLDEGEEELIQAEDWYEEQRVGLGLEFRIAIDEAMERLTVDPIGDSPLPYVPQAVGARWVLVRRFPYSIIYITVEEDIWVLAFAHHSRRPGYWRRRRPRR